MMRSRWMIGLLALTALVVGPGCSKAYTETTLKPDGSGNRKVTFTLSKGMEEKAPKVDDYFKLSRASGAKITEKADDKGDLVVTMERNLAAGAAPFTDIELREKDGIRLRNLVSVKNLGDGKLEYTETITWVSAKKTDFTKQNTQFARLLPKALPAGVSDEATNQKIASEAASSMVQLMFGPNEPMILMLMTHPEYTLKKFKARFAKSLDSVMARNLDEKMDAAARKDAIKKLVALLDAESVVGDKEQAGQEASEDKTGLVAFTFSVTMPGEVIETNGELDELSGDVSWAMFGEGAQAGPVVLRAVSKVP
jgi:hypothetical protein